jgi:ADP-ribosylglycohydrolase
MLSLQIALWALLKARTFEEGITDVALLGGDCETYAAIAGALLGAHFGLSGIPNEWRTTLIGYDLVLDLAEKLDDVARR